MRAIELLFLLGWFVLLSCSPKTEPLPVDSWVGGCIELAPYEGAYRLTGICCEYIVLPEIKLDNNRSFAVKGTYFTFTGAGFANIPILIRGQLAPDGSTLTISYSVNSVLATYTLRPGKATAVCFCACD